MSAETPMFVFVGSPTRRADLKALVDDRGWFMHDAPEDALMGTLAQVITFFPDAVVIEDTGEGTGHEVVMHLESIHYTPLFLLTDTPELWETAGGAFAAVLPLRTKGYEVLDALRALLLDAEPAWA